MEKIYDLVIIGSGPAGLTAGIYGMRAKLDTVIIEKEPLSGGQIINTTEIDNYPGLPGISGFELAQKMRTHYDDIAGEIVTGQVVNIHNDTIKEVFLDNGTVLKTKTIIIAGGAVHRKLQVPGEAKLAGMGVSYCATCDGAFFRNKTTVVVGGGDVALGDAIFLSRMCKQVYVVHRRDAFRGAASIASQLETINNITILWNSVVESIDGDTKVQSVHIKNTQDGTVSSLDCDGVFVAVGMTPLSDIYKNLLDTDDYGYIIADESCETSCPGIFAAGDIRTKPLRQVINAAADGASAVYGAEQYIHQL